MSAPRMKFVDNSSFELSDYALQMFTVFPCDFRNAVLGLNFQGEKTTDFLDLNVGGEKQEANVAALDTILSGLGFPGVARRHLKFFQVLQQKDRGVKLALELQQLLGDTDPVYFSDHPPTESGKEMLAKLA